MPIDYSPLFRSPQPSGVSRGLKFFGDAVGAVMERRQRMEMERARQAADMEQARMQDARAREGIRQNAEIAQTAAVDREHYRRTLDEDRDLERLRREDEHGPKLLMAAQAAASLPKGPESGVPARLQGEYEEWDKARRARRAAASAPPAAERTFQPPPADPNMNPFGRQPAAAPEPDFTFDEDPSVRPALPPRLPAAEPPPPVTGPPRTNVRPEDVAPPLVGGAPVSLPQAVAGPPPPPAAVPPPPGAPPVSLPQAVGGPPALNLGAAGSKQIAADWLRTQLADKNHPQAIREIIPSIAASGALMPAREAAEKMAADLKTAYAEMHDNANAAADRELRKEKNDLDKSNKLSLVSARYLGEAKSILGMLGYEKLRTDGEALGELKTIAGGADAMAGLASLLRGRWAKFGQGAGVLTDQDLRVFYESIGGIAQRWGTTAEQMLTGTISPEVKKDIEDAIDVLKKHTEERQLEMAQRFSAYFSKTPEGPARLPQFLESLFPSYWERQQRRGGGGTAAPSAPAGGAAPPAPAGPDTKAIDAGIEALRRRLRPGAQK